MGRSTRRAGREAEQAPPAGKKRRSTMVQVTIRVPEATLEILHEVFAHLPELYENPAAAQRAAMTIGALALAATAVDPDRPGQWGGLSSELLVGLLAQQLGPSIHLMALHGYLTGVFPPAPSSAEQEATPASEGAGTPGSPSLEQRITPESVADLDFFGGHDVLDD